MLRLTLIGDIFPGDEIFTAGFGIRSRTTKENAPVWSREMASVTGPADYVIGNLESPLSDDPGAALFCGRTMFADVLKEAGVNVLNIANNHIMEHGPEGYQETLSVLGSRGIHVIGQAEEGLSRILTLKKDGTTVCMAGFCDDRISSLDNPGLYADLEEGRALRTLAKMKELHPDIILFCLHWGNEYIHIPSPEQRRMAHLLIDGGADLVVGHHPHVIQPYEQYKKGHIFYSLGNFCFDDVQSRHFGRGMAAHVEVSGSEITGVFFSGVQVQDMAFGDSLVRAMADRKILSLLSRINGKYASLGALPDERYQRMYDRKCRRARTRERILMRWNIVKKLVAPRHRHRRQFISNLINRMHGA